MRCGAAAVYLITQYSLPKKPAGCTVSSCQTLNFDFKAKNAFKKQIMGTLLP